MNSIFFKLCSFIFLSFLITGCTSIPQSKEPLKEVSKVIEFKGINQENIFELAEQWASEAFVSSNDAVRYTDKSAGTIIAKGNFKYSCPDMSSLCIATVEDRIKFTLKIETKDNKAKVTFTDIRGYRPPKLYSGVAQVTTIESQEYPITFIPQQDHIKKQTDDFMTEFSLYINNAKKDNSSW